MNIEKGKISNGQLVLVIIGYIQGAVYVVSFATTLSKHDTWLIVLAGLAITVFFGYICASLTKRFPNLNLAAIHNTIYGRYLGTSVSVYYLCYFLFLFSISTQYIGEFYTIFFMRETPQEILMTVFVFVCAYTVWNGIEVLARITPFIVISVSLIIIITAFILLPKMDFSNFLPIGELSFKNFIHSTQIIAEIPFGIVLTIFLPISFARNDQRHGESWLLLGLLSGAVFFAVTVIQNTAVLGNTEGILFSPSFQTLRLINIGFLSRWDIFFAVSHTFGQFLMCSIYFYITVLLLSQVLELQTYSPLIFPLGCITVILGLILYPSDTAHFQSIQNVEIMFFFPVMFIFPPLSLLIAKIRNLPEKGATNS